MEKVESLEADLSMVCDAMGQARAEMDAVIDTNLPKFLSVFSRYKELCCELKIVKEQLAAQKSDEKITVPHWS